MIKPICLLSTIGILSIIANTSIVIYDLNKTLGYTINESASRSVQFGILSLSGLICGIIYHGNK
jgi:hypothetical protein